MVLATTELKAKDILGVVCGEVVMGNSAAKDLKASIKAFTGGRTIGYEAGLKEAREEALNEMVKEAETLNANAVMGVSVDYEIIADGSMVVATASGTAIVQ